MSTDSSNTPAEWLAAGLSADDAKTFIDAGVPLAVARQWAMTEIDADDAVEYIEKTVPLDVATEFHERGIELWQITRTDTAYEVELEPWQKDPVDQLPEVIERGRFGLSLWSATPWDDSHIENEVALQWDGQTTVEWSVLSGSGLSMMSEVSFSGIAGWPDGKNVLVSYSGDGGLGFQRLAGAAPTGGGPGGARDPQHWVEFANSLVGLTDELSNSGIESNDEFAYEYRRTADDEWFEFDDLFRVYLASAGSDGDLPGFDDWISDALKDGTYEID
ncbi:hypothetical protein A5719_17645 [Mycolicibacterium peregrinum]|uniref:hypothetical protein n=1 Tax=Mycolicibacterium peregrinum TaxID=43304 RepID=UPI0007EA971F|nr:hypothetical protein [Mycolicibacterium peregrinum]OBF38954.1 hypothetical protein A5719_17645 [Mycolicibacterium peregrinum]